MMTYTKIETVFKRDERGTKKLIPGDFRNETVKYLSGLPWVFTEKIDGTNIRVHWDGHAVEFGGRTERAQIPATLVKYLNATFNTPETEELFEQKFGGVDVILFGEGYGAGIQNGGAYRPDVSFILFDVFCGGLWLKRDAIEDIARTFAIDAVPVVLTGTISDGVEFVKAGQKSTIGAADMEGIVGKPAIDLLDRRGERVIVKIKQRDFD